MTTSKSPKNIALAAYTAAQEAFPDYRSKFSPKKFTQPQLVACLVLKEFFKKDYRGITVLLADFSDVQLILELKSIPHYTTLQKSAQKLCNSKGMRRLMKSILVIATTMNIMGKTIQRAALDGTGFESHHISSYFVQRKDRTVTDKYQTSLYTRFPKVGIVCDTDSHVIMSGIPERGASI